MCWSNFVFQSGGHNWGPEWSRWGRDRHNRDLLLELRRDLDVASPDATLAFGFFLEIDGSLREPGPFKEGIGRRRFYPASSGWPPSLGTTIRIPMSWIVLEDEEEFRRRFAGAHRDALASLVEFGVKKKGLEIDVAKLWEIFDGALGRYLALPLPLEPFRARPDTIAQNPERTLAWWQERWAEFDASMPTASPAERDAFARSLVRELNRRLKQEREGEGRKTV